MSPLGGAKRRRGHQMPVGLGISVSYSHFGLYMPIQYNGGKAQIVTAISPTEDMHFSLYPPRQIRALAYNIGGLLNAELPQGDPIIL